MGVVEETKTQVITSNLLAVPKKWGEMRLVSDLRGPNKYTKPPKPKAFCPPISISRNKSGMFTCIIERESHNAAGTYEGQVLKRGFPVVREGVTNVKLQYSEERGQGIFIYDRVPRNTDY